MSTIKLPTSLKAISRADKGNFSRGDKFTVDPRIIEVREGYNVRNLDEMTEEDRAEYNAYVDGLAQAYANGEYVPAIVVRVIDGKVVVSEGHTRHKGMMRAINTYGAELPRVTVEEFKGSDAQEKALMATTQNNRKLRALELAALYERLANEESLDDAGIAKLVGQSVESVARYRAYATMPEELKSFVNLNRIAVSVAMDMFEQHGDAVVDIAASKINSAKKDGKKKVTATMGLPKMTVKQRKTLNSTTAGIFDAVKDIEAPESGEVTVTLNAELVRAIQELGPKAQEILAAELAKQSKADQPSTEEQQALPLSKAA